MLKKLIVLEFSFLSVYKIVLLSGDHSKSEGEIPSSGTADDSLRF
jgi:hypothetical protein